MTTAAPAANAPASPVAQAADAVVDDLLASMTINGVDVPLNYAPGADAGAGKEADAGEGGGDEAGAEGDAAQDDAAADDAGDVEAAAAEGGEEEGAADDDDAAAGEDEGAAEGEEEGAEEAAAEEEPVEKAPPAAAAAAKPAAEDPAAVARAAEQAKAYEKWEEDFGRLDQKLAGTWRDPADGKVKAFDAIDDGPEAVAAMHTGFKLMRQAIGELHQQQETLRQERAVERFWQDWGRQNPAIPVEKAQRAFQEEYTAALAKHRDPRVATALAEERWASRMKVSAGVAASKAGKPRVARPAGAAGATTSPAAKPGAKPVAKPAAAAPAAKKPVSGKPPTPVTPGGGRVLPPAAKAPPKRAQTFREKVDSGAYGNFAGLVD